MGTIRNEMTIVHCWDKNKLESVREDAINFFNEVVNNRDPNAHINVADFMISPIMQSYINQEYTFVINGDCSKINWETSEQFHEARMKWCKKHKHDVENIIVINFGEGDEPCRIIFDSRAKSEKQTSKTFPKNCTEECKYYHRWDLSVDDYTNVCNKLHIQVDDCDAYGPFYIPRLCPLEESEE